MTGKHRRNSKNSQGIHHGSHGEMNMSDELSLSDITIIIPTYNRTRYLRRLLAYFNSQDFNCPLVVADSGNEKQSPETIDLLNAGHITYKKLPPETTTIEKLCSIISMIDTPFVAVCADDDFLVPKSVAICADFLRKHPDYSMAMGQICVHWLEINGADIHFKWRPRPFVRSIESTSPTERLELHFKHYSPTFYSIHRSDSFAEKFHATTRMTGNGRLGELALSAISIIEGNVNVLPILYSSREISLSSIEHNMTSLPYFNLPWKALFQSPRFDDDFERILVFFSKRLSTLNGISITDARDEIRDIFNIYFNLRQKEINRPILLRKLLSISDTIFGALERKKRRNSFIQMEDFPEQIRHIETAVVSAAINVLNS